MNRLEKLAVEQMLVKHREIVELVKKRASSTPQEEKEINRKIDELEDSFDDLHDALITGE